MKIYLAAGVAAATVRAIAERLRVAGYVITSTWHDIDAPTRLDCPPLAKMDAAREMDQIQAADVVVALTEELSPHSGSPWFELGVAHNKCMDCFVLGPAVNAFCHLPGVRQFDTKAALLEELAFLARFLYRPSPARPPAVVVAQ